MRSRFEGLLTERIHPRARRLDGMSPPALLRLMSAEDRRVVAAVARASAVLERGAEWMAETLAGGGRVFYLGAGTSGRLGVLEAAECPPTFGTRPGQVQALLAGGRGAVFRAREGAEDRGAEAVEALRARGISRRDLVVGISASSVTAFVRRGLAHARRRGARTMLLTCGVAGREAAQLVIPLRVGPELLAGSTRLKAGTATKLALNRLTLLAMIRLGKVYGPFMVDLRTGSRKLRDRARRMVELVGGVTPAGAKRLLAESGGEVKTAILCARLGLAARAGRARLRAAGGSLRRALEGRFKP